MIYFKPHLLAIAAAAAAVQQDAFAYASDIPRFLQVQVTNPCAECQDPETCFISDECYPACPDPPSESDGFCMCGECDANNCKYIGTSAGNVPATLYLRPIDPKSCGFLFVKFNTQGNGQNACGPIEADSAEKEFKQQVFLVTEKSVAGCSGNKSTKLNPEIKVACSSSNDSPPDSDFFAIHTSCSQQLYYGQIFGPNLVSIAGACSGQEGTGSCGYDTGGKPNEANPNAICCIAPSQTPPPSPQPFASPSANPTVSPTDKPSPSPFANPSESPSAEPSASPSDTPTSRPSLSPSDKPSLSPSANPSESPSAPPSVSPSDTPSTKPSLSPSDKPSLSPSANPSESPSAPPSVSPSDKPSTKPSLSPSDKPSLSPSANPSESPSAPPSVSPSDKPSTKPSLSPSDKPSLSPSANPSESPSAPPSVSPSDKPSTKPSLSPSDKPSLSPSANPSESPSAPPSVSPSDKPSTKPSLSPSDKPSLSPSANPSESPSAPPSVSPSDKPSLSPSDEPSTFPTAPVCPSNPTDALDYPCICGSCDRKSCISANICNNEDPPFCGTNTGCKYIQGATPPLEISLAFVGNGRVSTPPPFSCIQVQLQQGDCTVNVALTDGLFTINKDKCPPKVKKGNMKLNPDVLLVKYGTLQDKTNTCDFEQGGDVFSGGGTEIHTSCSQPIYVGKRYEVTYGFGVTAELFITAFCNSGGGGGAQNCRGNFPAECDDSAVANPGASSAAGQAETSFWDVMKISDFQTALGDSYSYNASVKSKICTSILGVIMMLAMLCWCQRQ